MPTTVFGRVGLLLEVVKIALPIFFVAFAIFFALVAVFAIRYRKALKHKLLSLPVRTVWPRYGRRTRTYTSGQKAQQ